MKSQSTKKILYRMLCGFFLGISVIAPGVSGSVMAVMMGIYDDLINIISNPFKDFKRNFIYLFPMGVGAVLSVAILIQALRLLFENFPIPAFLLFVGLIAGSLPAVFKEANDGLIKKRHIVAIICAFAFALTIGIIAKSEFTLSMNTNNIYYLSICGAIAGITSMIPGMSVSMVLMTLGVYTPLLEAASDFEFITILPVGICFVIGMVMFSKLTKLIFKKYRSIAYYMVFGFMTGTIISIFPGLPKSTLNWFLSIVTITVGLYISFLFQKLSIKFKNN